MINEEEITEEEIEFMESWYNPICLSESLFSNMDNLSLFDENKSIDLWIGQYPLLSYEYMIDTEVEGLTEKEKFALREGAGNIYCFAGRGWGKCEYENSKCLLADGSYKTYKELIGTQQEIFCFDEIDKQIKKGTANFYENGIKDCWKVFLNSGKEIIITENHPLFTDRGWKECKYLKNGDFIATPYKYNVNGKIKVDANVAKILGYLLGDGSTSQTAHSGVRFTNRNKEVIQEFKEILDYFECECSTKDNLNYVIKKRKDYRRKQYIRGVGYIPGLGGSKNKIAQLVLKYGIDKISKNKTIPIEVFSWKNKNIALLINRLFACDAHINKMGGIEFAIASKIMAYQVSSLLLRFGIHSDIYYKQATCNNKKFDAWKLCIHRDYTKFIKLIGIKSKDTNYNFSSNDRGGGFIPSLLIKKIYNSFINKEKLGLRKLLQCNPTIKKLKRINKIEKNKDLTNIINSNICWDKIKFIEYFGKVNTVAIEVPKYHTYISNDIYSHNTQCGEKLDLILYLLCEENETCGFSSFDFQHIQGVLESILKALEHHPIIKHFIENVKRNPYYIYTKNGLLVESVNMNIADGKKAGSAFFQKHFKKLYLEEASRENQQVYENRLEAKSPYGVVIRALGMTNFTRNSPPGKMFFENENPSQVLNVPAYINPSYDKKEEQRNIRKYGGKQAISFRTFVDGDIIQEGVSALDMLRIRENCYPKDKDGFIDYNNGIKNFEINQETFFNYKNILVVERPSNVEQLYVASDIGDIGGTSEPIVMGLVNKKWRYLYNITLRNLDNKQQYQIFKFLYKKLNVDFMGNDCSDGSGKALFRDLRDDPEIDSKKLVWVDLKTNEPIGYEKDEKGNPIRKDGKLVVQFENCLIWSVQRLCYLLYTPLLFLPYDYKLDSQLESVVAVPRGNSVGYECLTEENHLWQSFEIFSIMQWRNEFEGFSKAQNPNSLRSRVISAGIGV
jgi:intein/homing endonuclease